MYKNIQTCYPRDSNSTQTLKFPIRFVFLANLDAIETYVLEYNGWLALQ